MGIRRMKLQGSEVLGGLVGPTELELATALPDWDTIVQ